MWRLYWFQVDALGARRRETSAPLEKAIPYSESDLMESIGK